MIYMDAFFSVFVLFPDFSAARYFHCTVVYTTGVSASEIGQIGQSAWRQALLLRFHALAIQSANREDTTYRVKFASVGEECNSSQ